MSENILHQAPAAQARKREPSSALIAIMDRLRSERDDAGAVSPRHSLVARDVLALVVVADRCGGLSGACTASLPTLAATAGTSRTTMQRAIASLVTHGWLSRTPRARHETDVLSIGPNLKRSQPEMSHRETSQPETSHVEQATYHGGTSETYQVGTQSSPLKLSKKVSFSGPPDGEPLPDPVEVFPTDTDPSIERTTTTEKVEVVPIAEIIPPGRGTRSKSNGGNGSTGEAWSREAAEDFQAEYGGTPTKVFFGHLGPIVRRYGWARTRPVLRLYMAETAIDYLNVAKVVGGSFETLEERLPFGPRTRGDRGNGASGNLSVLSAFVNQVRAQ
jgi:hypothetical protein